MNATNLEVLAARASHLRRLSVDADKDGRKERAEARALVREEFAARDAISRAATEFLKSKGFNARGVRR